MNGGADSVELTTPGATRALGRRIASVLRAGDLVIVDGPLGAGKTVLAQGVGAGLGVAGPITSPTFVIARVHRPDPGRGGVLPLVHADAYRLRGPAEVDDLDLDTSVDESVTLVEWGGGAVEQLADAHLHIRIECRDDDTRVARLAGHGGDWPRRLSAFIATLVDDDAAMAAEQGGE